MNLSHPAGTVCRRQGQSRVESLMMGARALPAHSNQSTAGKSPAAGGAEALTAGGGEGASIAKMYILRACRGNPLTPMPPADGKLKQLGADQHEETSTPHKPKIICQRILSVHKKCEKEENISNTQWRKEM